MKPVRAPAVRLYDHCGHLLAQDWLESQIPPQTYIVLSVCAEERLARPKHRYGNGYKSNKISRPVGQEIGERTELETPVVLSRQKGVVLHAFHERTELQGMNSFDQRDVVSPLK